MDSTIGLINNKLLKLKRILNVLQVRLEKINSICDRINIVGSYCHDYYSIDNKLSIERKTAQDNYNEVFLLYHRLINPKYKKYNCDFKQLDRIIKNNK